MLCSIYNESIMFVWIDTKLPYACVCVCVSLSFCVNKYPATKVRDSL